MRTSPKTYARGKQEHFRVKLEAYQRRIQDFNREVQEKQRSMVAEYAQKNSGRCLDCCAEGRVYGGDRPGSESTVKIVVYGHPSVDLTEQSSRIRSAEQVTVRRHRSCKTGGGADVSDGQR